MDIIARLLLTSAGVLPRRAVLIDGKVGEKNGSPREQDLDFVSNACDVIRGERGDPCYPRDSDALFQVCLHADDPEAWRWMARDIGIGAFSMRHETEECGAYWQRFLGARTVAHVLDIVKCGSAIRWSDEGKQKHRFVFETTYRHIMDKVLEVCKYEFSTTTADFVSHMQALMALVDPRDTTGPISHLVSKNALPYLAMFEKCRIDPGCIKILLPALTSTPTPETAIFVLLSKASVDGRNVLFENDGPAILSKAVSRLLALPDIDTKTAMVVMCLCKQLFVTGSLSSHVTSLAMAMACNANT